VRVQKVFIRAGREAAALIISEIFAYDFGPD
jgi:hypothetical protein